MPKARLKTSLSEHTTAIRIIYSAVLFLMLVATTGTVVLLKAKEFAFDTAFFGVQTTAPKDLPTELTAFPIGVNPQKEVITENPQIATFFDNQLSSNTQRPRASWIEHSLALLSRSPWFQGLASPIARILVIEPGERKEQVVNDFAQILLWDNDQKETFTALVTESVPQIDDGKFFPDHYVVGKDATPVDVAQLLLEKFNSEVLSHYTSDISKVVPLTDTLTIASLLEREAYSFDDMRSISGIIWNRLFAGMNLQIDASLQYAKANSGNTKWWPQVKPADKYIDSPFNTYENAGLPPSPIASPSLEAILAALNPKKTDCLFYFHDNDGGFHCSKTYEEHVALLKQYYGRGK